MLVVFTYLESVTKKLGGGNSNMFYFHPDPWERFDSNFLTFAYFSDGLVQPPAR